MKWVESVSYKLSQKVLRKLRNPWPVQCGATPLGRNSKSEMLLFIASHLLHRLFPTRRQIILRHEAKFGLNAPAIHSDIFRIFVYGCPCNRRRAAKDPRAVFHQPCRPAHGRNRQRKPRRFTAEGSANGFNDFIQCVKLTVRHIKNFTGCCRISCC